MTDNMFDKFVSDKLRDHQSTVPPGLWEKIERKKDKEPRGGFWWFRSIGIWAALFVLLAGTGYYLLSKSESDNPAISETVAAKDNSSVTTNTTTANKGNSNKSGKGVSAGNENQATDEQNDRSKLNNDEIVTDVTAKAINTNKSQDQNTITTKRSLKNSKAGNSTGKSNSHYSVGGDITSAGKSKLNFGKKINSITGKNNDEGSDRIARNGSDVPNATYNQLQIFSKGKLALMDRTNRFKNNLNLDASKLRIWGIDCPTAGKVRRNDLYLELYASPDFALKTVSGNNTAILQKKDSAESTQIGYTAGFRFSKAISDNMLLKAGFQYSQINERLDLRTENERRITTVITIRTVTTPAGTDTTIRDTTTLEQIGYSVRRTYNRYRSFEIPLLISYEFGNENLKFAVNGGMILNLRSWYSGETINDSLAVVSLNSKTAPTYKHNIGVGLYAGFSIIKPVSNKFDLFLEPYFRYNLGSMTSGATYTQKFNAAGVSFGIRYKIKGQRR